MGSPAFNLRPPSGMVAYAFASTGPTVQWKSGAGCRKDGSFANHFRLIDDFLRPVPGKARIGSIDHAGQQRSNSVKFRGNNSTASSAIQGNTRCKAIPSGAAAIKRKGVPVHTIT
jgi:hypothetical protein